MLRLLHLDSGREFGRELLVGHLIDVHPAEAHFVHRAIAESDGVGLAWGLYLLLAALSYQRMTCSMVYAGSNGATPPAYEYALIHAKLCLAQRSVSIFPCG